MADINEKKQTKKETVKTTPSESREIKFHSGKGGLSEIYSQGLQYAFVSKDGEQIHKFVYCKDFLQDAIQGMLHQTSKSIYGFRYDPKKMAPIDLETSRLLLVNKQDGSFAKKLPGVLHFLNQFEKHLHLKRTKGWVVSNTPDAYPSGGLYFESSGMWLSAPPMLSLYTLLLRTAFVHKEGNKWDATVDGVISGKIKAYQSNDRGYLASAKKSLDGIMAIGYRPFFYKDITRNYPKDTDISTMHNSTGIVSMSTGRTPVKYWSRKSLNERIKAAQEGRPWKKKEAAPPADNTKE